MGRIREQTDGQRWRNDDGRERVKDEPEEEPKREDFFRATCADCCVPFQITRELADRRYEDHRNFYCPNGHANHWPKPESTPDEEKEKLKSRVTDLQVKVRELEEDRAALRRQLDAQGPSAGLWYRLMSWRYPNLPHWRRKGR